MQGEPIIKAALNFARRKKVKVFYSAGLPDYSFILWDNRRGDLSTFLALFEDEDVESPLIVWDSGVCIQLNGIFYCYTEHNQEEESGAPGYDTGLEAEEETEEDELADELIKELTKRDPKMVANELAEKVHGAANALRSPYQLIHALADYMIESKGIRNAPRLYFKVIRRLRLTTTEELNEFINRLREELENIVEEEKKKRINEALEVCLEWFKEHKILKPRKADLERCLIEKGLKLKWTEKEALWSILRGRRG